MRTMIGKTIVLACLALLGPLSACAQPDPTPQPTSATPEDAAKGALPALVRLVDENNYKGLGFSSVDEVKRATIGDPLPVSMVRQDELARFVPGTDPMSLVHQTPRTLVPVLVDGQVRSSIFVHATGREGAVTVAGFGESALIQSLEKARRESMAQTKRPAASYFAVHVPVVTMYLVGYREQNRLMLIVPMTDPRFDIEAGQVIAASDLFVRFVPEARRVLDAPH